MNNFNNISKIGLAIGCYSAISGIAQNVFTAFMLVDAMERFKHIRLDVGTVVTFSHTSIMIVLSVMMVYDILKKRHILLIVCSIGYGIKIIIVIVTLINELNVYGFEIYNTINGIIKINEAILVMYCLYILYREMRVENSKRQQMQQVEIEHQNVIETTELNEIE